MAKEKRKTGKRLSGLPYFHIDFRVAVHYATNPQAYVISKKKVTSKTRLKMKAAPGGGYAISIKPLK